MTDATTIVPDQTPEGEKRPRVTRRGGLFVNDAELIELSALPVLQTKVRFGKYRGQQWSQMDACLSSCSSASGSGWTGWSATGARGRRASPRRPSYCGAFNFGLTPYPPSSIVR